MGAAATAHCGALALWHLDLNAQANARRSTCRLDALPSQTASFQHSSNTVAATSLYADAARTLDNSWKKGGTRAAAGGVDAQQRGKPCGAFRLIPQLRVSEQVSSGGNTSIQATTHKTHGLHTHNH